ncbi:MAG: bifunctional methylenetetrahydrofolate dehydrogenase/methenyltetrahydrofolate cyclohydrolase, partial [Phycisphaerales bacterium]|nr:bifunctional methylenetetrahydrofolate dehydrogenase/methenyltetrahydrofolate cyclohydrolase [Phycisphaerales bacterium]
VQRLKAEHGITPGLAVVIVGHDPGSQIYVSQKAKQTVELGMHSEKYELPDDTPEAEVLALVEKLNADPAIHGILVQLPVPRQIDPNKIIATISPDKDVDCFTPASVGKLQIGLPGPVSCTPLGCLMLLRDTLGSLAGLNAVIVGRSNIVGKPIAVLLMRHDATVVSCNKHTEDLPSLTRRADVLVAAAGVPGLIRADMVKPGAVVVDVGTTRVVGPDGKGRTVGDVAFEDVRQVAGWVSPVPGGVGPMTIAMLLENVVAASER